MPLSNADSVIVNLDNALRTIFAPATASRPTPKQDAFDPGTTGDASNSHPPQELSDAEKRLSAGLMRVNHVGEICAQALYTGQAAGTKSPALQSHLQASADEEVDHLAWTEQRLKELQSHKSFLNPFWYAGAFSLGYAAAKAGDKWSLGFVVETERQVEAHLNSHLDKLPQHDYASRAIVAAMRDDEAEHADKAQALGAAKLPAPIQAGMRLFAKVMTTVAYKI